MDEFFEEVAIWLRNKIFRELEENRMDHYRTVKINNAPANLHTFTVCRVFEHELWYWGTYDEEEVAVKAAREINGVIVGGKEISE